MIGTFSREAIARVRADLDAVEAELDRKDERSRVAAIAEPEALVAAARAMPPDEFSLLVTDKTNLPHVVGALYDHDPELFARAEQLLGRERVDRLLAVLPPYLKLRVDPNATPEYELTDQLVEGPREPIFDEDGAIVDHLPGKVSTRKIRKIKKQQRGELAPLPIHVPADTAAYAGLCALREAGEIQFASEPDGRGNVRLSSPYLADDMIVLAAAWEAWATLAPSLRSRAKATPATEREVLTAEGCARQARGVPLARPRRARRVKP